MKGCVFWAYRSYCFVRLHRADRYFAPTCSSDPFTERRLIPVTLRVSGVRGRAGMAGAGFEQQPPGAVSHATPHAPTFSQVPEEQKRSMPFRADRRL